MGIEESESDMSGGAIAYHLRENKAIERNLFIDLLAIVGRVKNISEYTYSGFGGPFLEDFKAIHSALRISKMNSIEMDENVWQRQAFNRPSTFIALHNCKSGDFLRSHEFIDGNIVWLDHTSPKGLYEKLSDFQLLVSKLGKYDVAKITLNANAGTLGNSDQENGSAHRLKKLLDRLGDYGRSDLEEDDVLPRRYPTTLMRAVQNAVGRLSTRKSGDYFQLLSAFVYQDGMHKMLTVTGVILDAKSDQDKVWFFEKSRIDHWLFKNLDWSPPQMISVPALSMKERMTLDAALPVSKDLNAGDHLVSTLGYCPSEVGNELDARQLLKNYAMLYRAYPLFSRVVL
jgi:hypothetical protein